MAVIAALTILCAAATTGLWGQHRLERGEKAGAKGAVAPPAAPSAPTGKAVEGAEEEEHAASGGFAWWRLVKPLGIATIALFTATLILGLLVPRNRAVLLRWHKILAFVAIAFALFHAVVVVFLD